MFGTRFSTVLASGILLLGSSAIAMAQAGGPPDPLPAEEAESHVDADVDPSVVVQNETTDTVGDEDGATDFSDWVQSLSDETSDNYLEGCERGLTIAHAASNVGPTNFEGDSYEADLSDHPAIAAGCADDTQSGLSGDNLPEDEERGEEFGRQTAEDNSGGDAEIENEVEDEDAGPPSEPGPPSDAGPSGNGGPPSDPGPPNGR